MHELTTSDEPTDLPKRQSSLSGPWVDETIEPFGLPKDVNANFSGVVAVVVLHVACRSKASGKTSPRRHGNRRIGQMYRTIDSDRS